MDAQSFNHTKTTVQVGSVVLSVSINLFLIFLIITKSSKKMGNYRFLMIFFCCYSLAFSVMDVVVRPFIHSHKSAFFMMMDLNDRAISAQMGNLMVCGMAGCFGVIIYGIAIHFIFRYFALERNGRVKYFDKKWLPIWFTIPILGGICWTLVTYLLFPMSSSSSEYLREAIDSAFASDINETAYAAAIFFPPDENGHHHFNWKCGLGLIFYLLIMIIPFTIVIFISVKSVEKIKNFPTSKHGKDFQLQLYKALVAQTLIPVVFLFIPFGIMFVFPLMEMDCKLLSTSMTFVYALYPVVDPLPIIFFIQSYRAAVSCLFSCTILPSNKVATVTEDVESREMSSI